jgi:hypothetical protein
MVNIVFYQNIDYQLINIIFGPNMLSYVNPPNKSITQTLKTMLLNLS